ncbi:MAG: hypothetical protein MUC38_10905 [Cyclobacteriaceae bacterium]|jgi:hypothetical protein|nr:hypothetical protein [Cyclobacteriaceae bacterium]
MRALIVCLVIVLAASGCRSSRGTTVVQPKTYKVWPKGNKYRISIPVGARRINLFERKRTKTVRMR